jgi:hypothetical protein
MTTHVKEKYKKTKESQYFVDVIESERGWGQKVDDTYFFDTLKEANEFVKEYNKDNNLPYVPEWYMYATAPEKLHKR